MALSDSALSELLDALRVGDGTDLVRELAQWALHQLIEARGRREDRSRPLRALRDPGDPPQRHAPDDVVDEGWRPQGKSAIAEGMAQAVEQDFAG